MKQRSLVKAAVPAFALILLVACGDDSPNTPPAPSAPPASAAPTTPPPPSPTLPGQASCSRLPLGTLNTDCTRSGANFDLGPLKDESFCAGRVKGSDGGAHDCREARAGPACLQE